MRPGETISGPPTYMARYGDTLTLRARIYNYSLQEMPTDAEVHVEFYAQPWDSGPAEFLKDADGGFAKAEFIGHDVLKPIPPFCPGPVNDCAGGPGSDTRNWEFAQTTWDTSTLLIPLQSSGVTHWKFWVVTWMQEGDTLVPELAEHGLKAIPGAHLNSLNDVPIETYSNNLGFYNQVFTLRPPDGAETAAVQASLVRPASHRADPPVDLAPVQELGVELDVPRKYWLRGPRSSGTMPVKATLTSSVPLKDVVVRFFDGDPAEEGVLFDVEMIPYIPADDPYVVAVYYQPDGCEVTKPGVRKPRHRGRGPWGRGVKTLFVEAIPHGDPVSPASAAAGARIIGARGCG